MDDLDYKDLFRDAIHTIAYIARAAGFDPNDPTVEPPAIVARVENQRAALKRLTTERAALLAPVEGVDLEEVLRNAERLEAILYIPAPDRTTGQRADREALYAVQAAAAPDLAREVARLRGTNAGLQDALEHIQQEIGAWAMQPEDPETTGRWHLADRMFSDWVCAENDRDPPDALTMVQAVLYDHRNERSYWREHVARGKADRALVVAHAHLATARRLLPPRYVAADGSILDPERCTPHARDCAECGRGRAHDEECLGVLETPAEEVARLRAALEEARLTLAAEQGRAEGAPFSSSPRLRAAVNAERIRQGLSWRGLAARIGVSSSGFTRWNAGHELSVPAYLKVCDWLRSAMLAADAATEAR